VETSDFDYELPAGRIAQTPVEPRDAARLLVDRGPGAAPGHRHVRDLAELLEPGDVVVVNTTRVLPARLRTARATGGAAEVLLLEPLDGDTASDAWEALVRPSAKLRPGTKLELGDDLAVVVGVDLGEGRRHVLLDRPTGAPVMDLLERHGAVPLPPYITAGLEDPERYQTTYAERPASVAAPTAGLHLTPAVLERVRARGVRVLDVELVVGLGTFRPIAAASVEDHHMHAERYRVPEATMAACAEAERVVAVGTTTVRALESATATGALEGRTELFLHGESGPQLVDVLLTNFHQPRSSLLVLVESLVGPRWRARIEEAVREGDRFLSFGDAMLLRGERGAA
jgi:S-adenosylmethionine:tRNA ribosyltransferase-isomerase